MVATQEDRARPLPTPARAPEPVFHKAVSTDAQPGEQQIWENTFAAETAEGSQPPTDVDEPQVDEDPGQPQKDLSELPALESGDSDSEVGMASCQQYCCMCTPRRHVKTRPLRIRTQMSFDRCSKTMASSMPTLMR